MGFSRKNTWTWIWHGNLMKFLMVFLMVISHGNFSWYFSRLRRSWRLRCQISLDWYSGSAAKSHSTSTQYRQLRRLEIHVHTSSTVSPFQAIMTLQISPTNFKGSILFSLDKLQWNEKSSFSRPIQMFILANSKWTVQDKSFKGKLKLLCYNNKKKKEKIYLWSLLLPQPSDPSCKYNWNAAISKQN